MTAKQGPIEPKPGGSARDRLRLLSAASAGKVDTVRKLLAAGVDPDGPVDQRGMALWLAIGGGHVSTVAALLDAGASAEIPVLEGRTAVALAKKLDPVLYRVLRECGARKTGEAAARRAAAEEERASAAARAHFWSTPVEQRCGRPPWLDDHPHFENLLVRAPVPAIKEALLADPLLAESTEPVRLILARPRGHAWSQVCGGTRLGGSRPLANERLAQFLSTALGTKALVHGFEAVSNEGYCRLFRSGRAVRLPADIDAVFRKEGLLDPDATWDIGPEGTPVLVATGAESAGGEWRREDFAEVDSI